MVSKHASKHSPHSVLAPVPQANAEHFGPELPLVPGGTNAVLYPSSSKASTELQVWVVGARGTFRGGWGASRARRDACKMLQRPGWHRAAGDACVRLPSGVEQPCGLSPAAVDASRSCGSKAAASGTPSHSVGNPCFPPTATLSDWPDKARLQRDPPEHLRHAASRQHRRRHAGGGHGRARAHHRLALGHQVRGC